MGKKRVRVGDVFEIPLSDGRKAFGQYAFRDPGEGPLIRVFDLILEGEVQPKEVLERLKTAGLLFPPVTTGVSAAVRTGLWKVIGRLPVDDFEYPRFVSTAHNTKTGQAGIWFLWDGRETIRLGSELPEKYKKLEYLVGWSPYEVVHRIEAGDDYEYPSPFGELIQHNEFTPDKMYTDE